MLIWAGGGWEVNPANLSNPRVSQAEPAPPYRLEQAAEAAPLPCSLTLRKKQNNPSFWILKLALRTAEKEFL